MGVSAMHAVLLLSYSQAVAARGLVLSIGQPQKPSCCSCSCSQIQTKLKRNCLPLPLACLLRPKGAYRP
jgi:hypothetical protein